MAETAQAFDMTPDEEAAFRAAVLEGVKQADAGLGRPFEELAPWLLSWGKDDELPPPT